MKKKLFIWWRKRNRNLWIKPKNKAKKAETFTSYTIQQQEVIHTHNTPPPPFHLPFSQPFIRFLQWSFLFFPLDCTDSQLQSLLNLFIFLDFCIVYVIFLDFKTQNSSGSSWVLLSSANFIWVSLHQFLL